MEKLFHDLLNAFSTGLNPLAITFALAAGLIAFFNPCMIGITPLLATRAGKWKGENSSSLTGHILMFSFGFMLSLFFWTTFFMSFFRLVNNWADLWTKLLGFIYAATSLYLFGLRLPRKFIPQAAGFYKARRSPHPYTASILLGVFIGLAPSPCTTPLIVAVSSIVIPTLGPVTGMVTILLYGIGHTIPLAFIALLSNKFRLIRHMRKLNKGLKIILASVLLILSMWFLFYQPTVMPNGTVHVPKAH